MRQLRKINFTKEGLDNLKKELEELHEKRPDAVKELSRARELGDLSENGLYTAAKGRLRSMDGRINRIKYMLKVAQVYTPPKDKAGIGSKVTVEQSNQTVEYEIVGDYEADPANKKISANSPIGRALIGKKINEETEFETPAATLKLKVLKIE